MITFINPWAFLWFFPVALIILVLYSRRMRRFVHETSAGEVWRNSISILDPRFWWRPWRRLTSLLVQLGIAFAFVFCMAEPCLRPPQRMAVVIDCTQSMADALQSEAKQTAETKQTAGTKQTAEAATVQNGQSEALQKLAEMVKNLGYHDRIALIAAEDPPRILCRTTSERDKILEALDQYLKNQKPNLTANPNAVQNALDVAQALVVREAGAKPNPKTENIVVISDGCFPNAEQAFEDPAVRWLPVGKTRESMPITRLGVRWNLEFKRGTVSSVNKSEESAGSSVVVLIEIANFSSKDNSGTLTVAADRQELTLKPNETKTVRVVVAEPDFQAAESEPGQTGPSVAVAWDAPINGASFKTQLAIPTLNRFPVYLISKGNDWLVGRLQAVPAVASVTTVTAVPDDLPTNAVLIFDGATPRAIPEARTLLFGPKKELALLWQADRETPTSSAVATVNWDYAPDFWNQVNLTGQRFASDATLTIADSGNAESNQETAVKTTVLALDDKGRPLGWSISRTIPDQIFVFNCDLSQSDWQTTPGFAALLNNIFARWSGNVSDPIVCQTFADQDGRIPQLDEPKFALPGEDVIPLWTIIGVLLLAAVCIEWVLYQRRWLE